MEQIQRIARMEGYLDEITAAEEALFAAADRYASVMDRVKELEEYYTGGVWLKDYEDDCAGKLPEGLKRGVLSQDGVHDLLEKHRLLLARLKELADSGDRRGEP